MNNTTETLRYVLKFNEGHMVPKHESVAKDIVKTCMYVFIIILILGFIINKEFLFSEMSLTAKISFFAAIGYTEFSRHI